MSIKHYGLFLPFTSLENPLNQETLNDTLKFLQAAIKREDIRFTVACSSFLNEHLQEAITKQGINRDKFNIISANYTFLFAPSFKLAFSILKKFKLSLKQKADLIFRKNNNKILKTIFFLPIVFLLLLVKMYKLIRREFKFLPSSVKAILKKPYLYSLKVFAAFQHYKKNVFLPKAKQFILQQNLSLLIKLINQHKHIQAWCIPTPHPIALKIQAPLLITISEMNIKHFPAAFAQQNDSQVLNNFIEKEQTICQGRFFVTNCEDIKWNILTKQYLKEESFVKVIRPASQILNDLLSVESFADNHHVSHQYSQRLLLAAIHKATNGPYSQYFQNGYVKFLVYVGKFNAHDNIIHLLKAYEYLLRKHFLMHKLLLIGDTNLPSEICNYIAETNLANDVLCLNNVSARELAACYHLADLAISPNLNTTRFPSIFTEALSMDTPVVLANTLAIHEVINDNKLEEAMLFDPYNWEDIAKRIEWALENRENLLALQKPIFSQLSKRDWNKVLDEYVEVLDTISSHSPFKTTFIEEQKQLA